MKVRKKPVEVEAVLWRGPDGAPGEGYPEWFRQLIRDTRAVNRIDWSTGALMLETQHGWAECAVGDYVIRGVQGEVYPCKADVFAETYEIV